MPAGFHSEAISPHLIAAGSHEHDRHVAFHSHTGVELIHVVEGRNRTICKECDARLDGWPGCLQVIPAGVQHDQQRFGVGRTIYVIVASCPSWLDSSPRVFDIDKEGMEALWMRHLWRLFSGGEESPWREQAQDNLLAALLSLLGARVRSGHNAVHMPDAVRHAVEWVGDDLTRSLSVKALAASVHLSASRFGALFRAHVGCGVLQYQQNLRIDLAKRLLRDPYLRVGEVARRCGYDDLNYFSRLFRKRVGCSPRDWAAEK